jgi:hypothetical protein
MAATVTSKKAITLAWPRDPHRVYIKIGAPMNLATSLLFKTFNIPFWVICLNHPQTIIED